MRGPTLLVALPLLIFIFLLASAHAKRLASKGYNVLVVQRSGDVFGTGHNGHGTLGLGHNRDVYTPQQMPGVSGVTDVASGDYHVCVKVGSGGAQCSGSGAIGNIAASVTNVVLTVSGLGSGIGELFCGSSTCFAVMAGTGRVCAWGSNTKGQLGNGNREDVVGIAQVTGTVDTLNVTAVGGGGLHTCFLTTMGKVFCAGYNAHGQVGNGDEDDYLHPAADVPVPVEVLRGTLPEGAKYTSISCGEYHSCASATDNKVYCWGANYLFQLGKNAETTNLNKPTPVADITSAREVWTGLSNTFVIDSTAARGVRAFGQGGAGTFGTGGNDADTSTPVTFGQGVQGIVEIRGGNLVTCILNEADEVWCTGRASYGQFGVGTTTESQSLVKMQLPTLAPTNQPTRAPTTLAPTYPMLPRETFPGSAPKRLAGQGLHFVMIMENGDGFAVGKNDRGQLALGSSAIADVVSTPQQMLGAEMITDASAGYQHSCVVAGGVDGQALCVGQGIDGQTGQNDQNMIYENHVLLPVMDVPWGVSRVYCGGENSFAVMASTGQVYAWGANQRGGLGLGSDDIVVRNPTIVAALAPYNITEIGAGYQHACFLAHSGHLRCAGRNTAGELGDGQAPVDSSVPVPVDASKLEAGELFVSVSCGDEHCCASTTHQDVYCWGSNVDHQVGQGPLFSSIPSFSLPTRVAGASDAAFVWTGPLSSYIVSGIDRTAQAFGKDQYNMFGADVGGYYGSSSIPRMFARGVANIAEIRGGRQAVCVLKVDKEVWCVGHNQWGQHGTAGTSDSRNMTRMQNLPTLAPTKQPTSSPTKQPTSAPTKQPTLAPTKQPTLAPTAHPTLAPTKQPTSAPTKQPTLAATKQPTLAPTKQPTLAPTKQPTSAPTKQPTLAPTASTGRPTSRLTAAPTSVPTKTTPKNPTGKPTVAPTKKPTTKTPTKKPTAAPTSKPTKKPTKAPTKYPTKAPTSKPTKKTTAAPTKYPTKAPTSKPTTKYPTKFPTKAPTS